MPTSIAVIDPDESARLPLRPVFVKVGLSVWEFEDGESYLRHTEPHLGLFTELRLPGKAGIDVLAALQQRRHPLPVAVLTAHADVPTAVEAMKRGAIDVLEHPCDPGKLLAVVERMHALYALHRHGLPLHRHIMQSLSAREIEVLERVFAGRMNKQIADDLGVTSKTVEFHRANLMRKCSATTMAELLRIAVLGKACR
ncbi:response regulator transcription factor [Candidatus Symbiobacter mobilis]|uniref:Response regulator n=1 Tax=Candidatus Symbiobacter mobilis CR TaxID=946483 RepID=U5NDJ8_9BURK|nr:LuxR C-terminal-related transcriptional regulator [Candidatus Symbiobacter mobilis]AGX88244.1 response regulator [Candidatus Symbiobacter mobilis CR]